MYLHLGLFCLDAKINKISPPAALETQSSQRVFFYFFPLRGRKEISLSPSGTITFISSIDTHQFRVPENPEIIKTAGKLLRINL